MPSKPAAPTQPVDASDEPLEVTPRARMSRDFQAKGSTFDLPSRWFAERRAKTALLAIAIVVPLIALWITYRTVDRAKQATWTYNVDSAGVITYAPAEIADPSNRFFREIVLQASEVYLKRNPAGLSNSDLLKRYFTDATAKAVQLEVTRSAPERNRRNYFDQPEFTSNAELLSSSGGTLRYRVNGYIVRSGVLEGIPERDVGDFRLGFELVPNTDIKDKGRFPYLVNQYRLIVTWRNAGIMEEYLSSGQVNVTKIERGGRK